MTDAEILAIFEAHHPSNVDSLRQLGVEATYVTAGTSREGYRLSDNLLVKFQFNRDGQSEYEINCIRKINRYRKYEDLRKHIPTLYYANKKTGTLIVTFYPEESPYNSPVVRKERERLTNEFRNRLNVVDLHDGNFRMDANGYQIVIDLGWREYKNV